MTTILVVFASFFGGLVAVIIGQFLEYYRSQQEKLEEVYVMLKIIQNLDSEETPYSQDPEDIRELLDVMKDLYIRTNWILDDGTEHYLGELIKSLQSFENSHRIISEKDQFKEKTGTEMKEIQQARQTKESALKYAEKAAKNIDDSFNRIPLRRFIPRYLGHFES